MEGWDRQPGIGFPGGVIPGTGAAERPFNGSKAVRSGIPDQPQLSAAAFEDPKSRTVWNGRRRSFRGSVFGSVCPERDVPIGPRGKRSADAQENRICGDGSRAGVAGPSLDPCPQGAGTQAGIIARPQGLGITQGSLQQVLGYPAEELDRVKNGITNLIGSFAISDRGGGAEDGEEGT